MGDKRFLDAQKIIVRGLVVKAQSGFFTVQTADHGLVVSQVRKRLLQARLEADPVTIGDRVEVLVQPDGSGTIETISPREHAFIRQKPSAEGRGADRLFDRGQVIIANPDQIVLVFACALPAPHLKAVDRMLVISERAGIPAVICANKVDLVGEHEARAMFGIYETLGYPVCYTSAVTGTGVDELRALLKDQISALTGPSGVGKSSLLNAIQPGLGLAARTVSEATTKGRHTTVAPELYALNGGGYVADTPGIRSIGLYNIEPSEIDGYFPEIRDRIDQCRFKDCRHENEPGCAVREAVESGEVLQERYESYLRLREEAEEVYYRC
ncbi:MAG: ribosome small subunit-dependent GTPase A [Anaerolineae bacterium]|nr:ribosome small subunit-dependent GTPase A [Anaerolineae bacterium]